MHISVDSLVTIKQGEPWAGEAGIVESIRVFFDLGPVPVTFIDVRLESGNIIPFTADQLQRHVPQFSRDSVSARLGPVVTDPLKAVA